MKNKENDKNMKIHTPKEKRETTLATDTQVTNKQKSVARKSHAKGKHGKQRILKSKNTEEFGQAGRKNDSSAGIILVNESIDD